MPGRTEERSPRAGATRYDRGLSGDRTALAWNRSSLSIASTAVLTARAAFIGHLWILGVGAGIALAAISVTIHRHAELIYAGRRGPGADRHHQAEAFRLLTAATLATALTAAVVGVAIA